MNETEEIFSNLTNQMVKIKYNCYGVYRNYVLIYERNWKVYITIGFTMLFLKFYKKNKQTPRFNIILNSYGNPNEPTNLTDEPIYIENLRKENINRIVDAVEGVFIGVV